MSIKYVTSTGHTLEITALSPDYALAIKKGVEYPEPPTYEFEVLGGTKETAPHTYETEKSEEDQALWDQYIFDLNMARNEEYIRKARAVFRKCVTVEMPEDDTWAELQEADGIEVPEDEPERRIHYIRTECVGTETDVLSVVSAAESLSKFNREDYQHALNLFRDHMAGDAS